MYSPRHATWCYECLPTTRSQVGYVYHDSSFVVLECASWHSQGLSGARWKRFPEEFVRLTSVEGDWDYHDGNTSECCPPKKIVKRYKSKSYLKHNHQYIGTNLWWQYLPGMARKSLLDRMCKNLEDELRPPTSDWQCRPTRDFARR